MMRSTVDFLDSLSHNSTSTEATQRQQTEGRPSKDCPSSTASRTCEHVRTYVIGILNSLDFSGSYTMIPTIFLPSTHVTCTKFGSVRLSCMTIVCRPAISPACPDRAHHCGYDRVERRRV